MLKTCMNEKYIWIGVKLYKQKIHLATMYSFVFLLYSSNDPCCF